MLRKWTWQSSVRQVGRVSDEQPEVQSEQLPATGVSIEVTAGQGTGELGGGGGADRGGGRRGRLGSDDTELLVIRAVTEVEIIHSDIARPRASHCGYHDLNKVFLVKIILSPELTLKSSNLGISTLPCSQKSNLALLKSQTGILVMSLADSTYITISLMPSEFWYNAT